MKVNQKYFDPFTAAELRESSYSSEGQINKYGSPDISVTVSTNASCVAAL